MMNSDVTAVKLNETLSPSENVVSGDSDTALLEGGWSSKLESGAVNKQSTLGGRKVLRAESGSAVTLSRS